MYRSSEAAMPALTVYGLPVFPDPELQSIDKCHLAGTNSKPSTLGHFTGNLIHRLDWLPFPPPPPILTAVNKKGNEVLQLEIPTFNYIRLY